MTTPRLFPEQGRADRVLWAGVAWVLTGVLSILGALYLAGGLKVTAADQAYRVIRILPGGMHTHGAIMVALGLALAYGLLAPLYGVPIREHLCRRVLTAAVGYAAWIVYAFGAAWVTTDTPTAAPMVWWSAGAALSVLLLVRPPEGHTTRKARRRDSRSAQPRRTACG